MQPISLLTRIVSLSPRTLRLLSSSFNAALHTSHLTLSPTTAESVQHTASYQHGQLPTNERLEMLGQRVLELHVTDVVDRTQPNGDLEGLTRPYLNHDRLAQLGRNIGLQEFTRYTLPAKSSDTGVDRIIVTGFRALIGAIYHDKMVAAIERSNTSSTGRHRRQGIHRRACAVATKCCGREKCTYRARLERLGLHIGITTYVVGKIELI
ncbi:ribonuclease-III-like-domain-containing protein [Jimgerdemannia flammicorona]|uniref:Ribonuclease-III-like-domain-containing protein n=1 Tax=Jimgerdemannia flammicorona TaxID=994334 RepID=A0A433QQ40_9FUNG|nr:ribonuclease-III-like-domain-containing protein [Jimgerdemannia flammicorona]